VNHSKKRQPWSKKAGVASEKLRQQGHTFVNVKTESKRVETGVPASGGTRKKTTGKVSSRGRFKHPNLDWEKPDN